MHIIPKIKPKAWVIQIINGRLDDLIRDQNGFKKIATGISDIPIIIPKYPKYLQVILEWANFFNRCCPFIVNDSAINNAGMPNPIDWSWKHL